MDCKILVLLFMVIFYNSVCLLGQSTHKNLRKGDRLYQEEKYSEAEERYRKSLISNPNHQSKFNLGNSIYQQDRYEESIEHYSDALSMAGTDTDKSMASYNLGNSYLKSGELDKSIESYNCLLYTSPSPRDA